MRPLRAWIVILLLLATAAGIVVAELRHDPTVLALSAAHGVDAGDLLAVPFILLALAAVRRLSPPAVARPWTLPAAAGALGVLLVLAGVLAHDGGALVPAGGGTLDGTIAQTFAGDPVRVEQWSNVALTYDGSTERLYVNGNLVSSHAAHGRIQTPENPLWIGGNRPYGEHFDGRIDEVRVYARALTAGELRADMAAPVAPARDLVAAYAFDSTATDASGNRNTGEVHGGATWAPGRFGEALSLDGVATVVRVPPSPSLGLTTAMTLSAWIRPNRRQEGWRTIVQRQADAYFLTASSGQIATTGAGDALRIALVLAAAGWFAFLIATRRAPVLDARRRSWWVPVALFGLGSLADIVFAPSGTLVGPLLVALWLAATARGTAERAATLLVAAACAVLTVASLADVAGIGDALYPNDGGTARTTALGTLLIIGALAARKLPALASVRHSMTRKRV